MKPKIAFFELEKWEEEHIKANLKDVKLKFFKSNLNERNAKKIKDFDAIGIFIYSQINKKILDKLPKLKLIATMSTGYDHIDLDECRKREISVCNVPSYGENTVAEHTFALILALSRRIIDSVNRTRRGNFDLEGLRGFDLKGKTIGIIGCGNIGKHVARIAKGFEMKILVYDIHKNMKLAKKIGFKYAGFENLLKNSDIISLHAPLLQSTKHMINLNNIKLIKKGAILVNTSRGGLVDGAAIIKALNKNILAGAALDVLEEEELIKEEKQLLSKQFPMERQRNVLEEHILIAKDNVIITPHNAFNSNEALIRILDTTIANVKGFLKNWKINVIK